MDPKKCYIYVKGWMADAGFKGRARAAAAEARHRECVIVPAEDQWPRNVPSCTEADCATVICGCTGHPHRCVECTANDYWIRKAFIEAEAGC